MAGALEIRVNDREARVALRNFSQRVKARPLLAIAGAIMMGSITQTFRDEGSPSGSWPPLAAWTRSGAFNRISFRTKRVLRFKDSPGGRAISKKAARHFSAGDISTTTSVVRGRGGPRPGKKLLVESGRLRKSVTRAIEGNTLRIGTNLVYAGIHQHGGVAGRRGPFKKKDGRRPMIPARPFVVFRPEDPQRMQEGMEAYIDHEAKQAGLK